MYGYIQKVHSTIRAYASCVHATAREQIAHDSLYRKLYNSGYGRVHHSYTHIASRQTYTLTRVCVMGSKCLCSDGAYYLKNSGLSAAGKLDRRAPQHTHATNNRRPITTSEAHVTAPTTHACLPRSTIAEITSVTVAPIRCDTLRCEHARRSLTRY